MPKWTKAQSKEQAPTDMRPVMPEGPEEAAPDVEPTPELLTVCATADGHYGGFYRREGDVFQVDNRPITVLDGEGKEVFLRDENGEIRRDNNGAPMKKTTTMFSPLWMEIVDGSTPTTPITRSRVRHPLDVMANAKQAPNTLSEATGSVI